MAASIDVEEEGLFSGKYARKNLPLRNIASLKLLAPLLEKGLSPTLFCVREAFIEPASQETLRWLRENFSLEIGCHLHHWNTPPFGDGQALPEFTRNVASIDVKIELLDQKLDALFSAARNFLGHEAHVFRMGRWDLHKCQMPLLPRHGVKVDASIRPMHAPGRGKDPDHFDFPTDPFWIEGDFGKFFEVPLTVTPILTPLMRLCGRNARLACSFKKWGALALLPVYHPLWLMKLASRMHIARGGRALSLTWHSSEMMPGGAPHIPTEGHAQKLLAKIGQWLDWLKRNYEVECVSMSEMRGKLASSAPVVKVCAED